METNQHLDLADFDRLISHSTRPNVSRILSDLKHRYQSTFLPKPQPLTHKKFDKINSPNLTTSTTNKPKKPKTEILPHLNPTDFNYEPEEYNFKLLKKYLINTKTPIPSSTLTHRLKILSDYSWNQTDSHIE